MKGIGLVFSGGGGKGAYEIGAWKYLQEVGLDQYVRAVSGTSVGALNAALFSGSTYEVAEKIWLNINPKDVLTPRKIGIKDIIRWLNVDIISNSMKVNHLALGYSAFENVVRGGISQIAKFLYKFLLRDHYFSRSGLVNIIKEGLDFKRLISSDIPCYATCLSYPDMQLDRFNLIEYEVEKIISILLASSAIPVLFPYEKFNDCLYYDGGLPIVGDNIPITPLYELNIEYIFVIHLNQDVLVDKSRFPNSKIIEIVPSCDLGNALTGTLDFSSEGAKKRIDLGYSDTKRVLQPLIDWQYLNMEKQMILKSIQRDNVESKQKVKELKKEKNIIKEEMLNDGFDELYFDLLGGK